MGYKNVMEEQIKTNEMIDKIINLIEEDESKIDWKEMGSEGGIVSRFAKDLGKKLKTTQLRKFFDEFVKIKAKLESSDLSLDKELYSNILPSVVYARGRDLCPDSFVNFIKKSIDKILEVNDENIKKKRFDIFMKILESIVSYNKFYELNPRGR